MVMYIKNKKKILYVAKLRKIILSSIINKNLFVISQKNVKIYYFKQ